MVSKKRRIWFLKGKNNVLDVVFPGEASQLAGCDRRTLKAWAKKMKAKPVAYNRRQRMPIWERHVIMPVVTAIKKAREEAENGKNNEWEI
jgi:hypothetical protein